MKQNKIKLLTYFTHIIFLFFLGLYVTISFDKNLKKEQTRIIEKRLQIENREVSLTKKPNEIKLEILPLPKLQNETEEKANKKNIYPNYKKKNKEPNNKTLERKQFKIIPLTVSKKKEKNVQIQTLKNKVSPSLKKLKLKNIKPLDPKKIQMQKIIFDKQDATNSILSKLNMRNDLKIKPLESKNLLKKKLNTKSENKKYILNFNDKKQNLMLANVNDEHTESKLQKFQGKGDKAIKANQNFQLEFLWPINTKHHDKIYQILDICLKSETVLMDKNNIIYGINGEIKRDILINKFSKIIRVPNNVHSYLEKNKIKKIKNKFLFNSSGKHLRLYKRNVDNYIIGFYMDLAEKNKIKLKNIKKFKGKFNIINGNLYLENLMINSVHFENKILLSSLNNNCNV